MNKTIRTTLFAAAASLLAFSAGAQTPPPDESELVIDVTGGRTAAMPIAIPPMPTPSRADTAAGGTEALGRQVSDIVANNLRNSGLFAPIGPERLRMPSYAEVTAPEFSYWSATGAQALVQGFVRANGDGTLTVGCYLYDVLARTELTRQGYVVSPGNWRRAAHKCSDAIYTRLTGEGPYFDTRLAYVSETGPVKNRIKRLAIMDQDGANHRFLTNGQSTVLTPRFSPAGDRLVYMSYQDERPRIFVYEIGSGRARPLVDQPHMTFAPRFSPDGRFILFSMAVNGNTDVYRIGATGGVPQRLTNAPGIDTGGSYSPDGSRIVFESDRGGTQQLYVMNGDGSNQRRISFGGGRYGTPVWSPRGDRIAFTRISGGFRVGVMNADGSGEQILSSGPLDEGPSWAPNGRVLMYFKGAGTPQLWSVDITGMAARRVPTPLGGSDPAWSPLLN